MTSTKILQRIEAPAHAPILFRDEADLADKAANMLGYTALRRQHLTIGDEYRLFEACAACGIRPFTTESVRRYMAAKQRYEGRKIGGVYGRRLSESQDVWKRQSLEHFNKPIPYDVLNMAVMLKEREPAATFMVYNLGEIQIPDPFLSACLRDAELFIAVWDEDKFEAKYE